MFKIESAHLSPKPMPRFTPYSLQLQITRMFQENQSFFAITKVQDWLKEKQQDPNDYEILFHQRPAPPGSGLVMVIEVELKRRDGQPVNEWLQAEVNK
jgi:lipopolysaccharide export LptBFGC system permease protein LptF